MLHIASGKTSWFGRKVKPGNMVYLAGEGHHGLRSRIAAWKHHHNVSSLNMWISKAGCDLNTAQGYIKVVEAVRALKVKPAIITVDTLHRFLAGDENSAQDAKTMLDACSALMQEFGCTVILVHHTGVSEEAQHRARGSSAWRGALDIEISIVPGKPGVSMQIIQRKSKDAEMAHTVYVDLASVQIPGWLDEDGEPVSSAVIVKGEEPVETKKVNGFDKFEKAWFASGAEEREELPYLTRSAMKAYCKENGISEGAEANKRTKLLKDAIIKEHENGWLVIDPGTAASMILKK